jgi:hypothetical protein
VCGYIILEKAVESTTSAYCTDSSRLFDDFSPHRMGVIRLRLKIIKKPRRISTLGTLATIQLLFLGLSYDGLIAQMLGHKIYIIPFEVDNFMILIKI